MEHADLYVFPWHLIDVVDMSQEIHDLKKA